MAELFLERLGPDSLVRSTGNFEYDFLVTFTNRNGGKNIFGVEVKGTESELPPSFLADKKLYARLTLSNIPGFLLIADVKRNKILFGWPERANRRIALHEVDDERVGELRNRLIDWPQAGERS